MARSCTIVVVLLHITTILCITSCPSEGALSYGFYSGSCPNLERIVFDAVARKFFKFPIATANALRIFNHECFVEGCDASVLISSNGTYRSERDAEINRSLPQDGFDLFLDAKAAVESRCPGVVSCADIMTIAARDSVYMLGGPRYEVQTGRRDGLISMASRVRRNLPQSSETIPQLIHLFRSKGLSIIDMVVLSGAHSVGASHCREFMSRIYHFNRTHDIDPTMDKEYAMKLRTTCPDKGLDPDIMAFNDPITPWTLDIAYYENLRKGMGLLATDQALYSSHETRDMVNVMANDKEAFRKRFGEAMNKMSSFGVKTGSEGEIRRDCTVFNSN